MRAVRKCGAVVAASLVLTALTTPPAQAFGGSIHGEITQSGLSASHTYPFVPSAILDQIILQHAYQDNDDNDGLDQLHFDDCEFDGGSAYIRSQYSAIQNQLLAGDPWKAAESFGRLLHPVQDFYAYSNWVELRGIPSSLEAAEEVRQSELVDISGAQVSLGQPCFAPAAGPVADVEVVRGTILLGSDDWTTVPSGWSVDRNGGGPFIPTLIDDEGRIRGRLLVSGEGFNDEECNIGSPFNIIYAGVEHDNLNKDDPTSGAADVSDEDKRLKHARAKALATLQTSYEWCRLVRQAGEVDREGMLLAFFVQEGYNPHPPDTPCSPNQVAPTRVVVTIDDVRVLDAKDGEGAVGEIQMSAALYDNPRNFRRSDHATNEFGRMSLRAGELVPRQQLPDPLILCVPRGNPARFALHAWDNDEPAADQYAYQFDGLGDNGDDVLVGIKREIGLQPPTALQVTRSSDLEVRYFVRRTDDAC